MSLVELEANDKLYCKKSEDRYIGILPSMTDLLDNKVTFFFLRIPHFINHPHIGDEE